MNDSVEFFNGQPKSLIPPYRTAVDLHKSETVGQPKQCRLRKFLSLRIIGWKFRYFNVILDSAWLHFQSSWWISLNYTSLYMCSGLIQDDSDPLREVANNVAF